jgi:hypothetical protein
MEKNDYNLNEKINIIYEYLYNSSNKNCFTIDKIKLGEIGLSTIKLSLPECINEKTKNKLESKSETNTICKTNIDDYTSIKKQILDGKFRIMYFNEELKQYILKRYSDELPITVKISFYNNDNSINNIDNIYNNDSLFSYLLSSLVLNKSNNTKHILLPIINIDMKLQDIEKYISSDSSYEIIKNELNNNRIIDTVCVQIREQFYSTQSLLEYIKNNECDYKLLFFQVFHTLALLQKEYNGFKHNNLILNNILIYLKQKSESYVEYHFKDKTYYVPNTNFDIKITNFEYSIIPKYYGLTNNSIENPYYDIYIFLNNLLENLNINDKIDNKCNKDTNEFLDRVIPKNIRGLKNFNNKNIIKPEDILNDKYFDEYKNKPKNSSIEENILYLTNKSIKTILKGNKKNLGIQNKLLSNNNIMDNKRFIKSEKNINNKLTRLGIMKGGYDNKITTNPYKSEGTGPFISNDMKKIKTKNYEPKEPAVLLEQKIYDTSKNKPEPQKPYDPYIPVFPESMVNNLLPYAKELVKPNIQKVYNVSLTNPVGNYTTINRIHEDELIGDVRTFSFNTTFERTQLNEYIYNNIIDKTNGEEMDITGSQNSFLEYIKLENRPNPYSIYKHPLKDLPMNFLIYRSGYPIKFNTNTKYVTMNKDSVGMNVRIYMMSIGDYRAKSLDTNIDQDRFDLWREMKYYDTIKNIVNKKISPNFIVPVLWKIDTHSKIKWDELQNMKKKDITFNNSNNIRLNQQIINNYHDLPNLKNVLSFIRNNKNTMENTKYNINTNNNSFKLREPISTPIDIIIPVGHYTLDEFINKVVQILNLSSKNVYNITKQIVGNDYKLFFTVNNNLMNPEIIITNNLYMIFGFNKNDKLVINKQLISKNNISTPLDFNNPNLDISMDSGKNLILLTEAPTSSLKQWASSVHESFGTVKKMIATGYHTPEVWKSILFQLIYSCAVLQKEEIYFPELSLNNFYIKDIFSDLHSIGCWIYNIDGIDYYVPNYGYILVFDTNYKDININNSSLTNINREYKIYSTKIYKENGKYDDNNKINTNIIDKFKELMKLDNFENKLVMEGANKISDDTKNIINNINTIFNNTTFTNIIDIIKKKDIFSDYLHNRVGTLLTKNEKDNVNLFANNVQYNKGNLIVYESRYQEFKWAIYCNSTNTNQHEIITKDNHKFDIKTVYSGTIHNYPDIVHPDSTDKMKYDESHIYERYNYES